MNKFKVGDIVIAKEDYWPGTVLSSTTLPGTEMRPETSSFLEKYKRYEIRHLSHSNYFHLKNKGGWLYSSDNFYTEEEFNKLQHNKEFKKKMDNL